MRPSKVEENEVYVRDGILTEAGRKLLVACVMKTCVIGGKPNFSAAARLMARHGVPISPRRIQDEWYSPGRYALESEASQARIALIREMEDHIKFKTLEAMSKFIELLSQDEGLQREVLASGGAKAIKDLAEAVAQLGVKTSAQTGGTTPIAPITLQRVDKAIVLGNTVAAKPVEELPEGEGRGHEPHG